MQVFIYENDNELYDRINRLLVASGHISTVINNKKEAFKIARHHTFDFYIIDISNSEDKGIEVFNAVRKHIKNPNVLLILPNNKSLYFIKQYKLNKSQYIEKPFDVEMFKDKLSINLNKEPNRIKLCETYSYDLDKEILLKNNIPISLSKHAHRLFKILTHRRGNVVSKEEIQKYVWGDTPMSHKAVVYYINLLRFRLQINFIETVLGQGYTINIFTKQLVFIGDIFNNILYNNNAQKYKIHLFNDYKSAIRLLEHKLNINIEFIFIDADTVKLNPRIVKNKILPYINNDKNIIFVTKNIQTKRYLDITFTQIEHIDILLNNTLNIN